jgi:hypothetical protein
MKSWLLDASMELTLSHEEGETSIYLVRLKFKDLFGNERSHFATAELPKLKQLQTRVSFTAMSSVNIRAGLVENVSDLKIRVMFSDCSVDADNLHTFPIKAGQLVHLVEHLDVVSGDGKFYDAVLPYNLPFDPEALCLQAVNADILDEAGTLLYRLSANPLPNGGCYGARMAT